MLALRLDDANVELELAVFVSFVFWGVWFRVLVFEVLGGGSC